MNTNDTTTQPALAYGAERRRDVNLCDPCMNKLGVDKQRAWMGHTSDDGLVRCDLCEAMEARLCFRLGDVYRVRPCHGETYTIDDAGRMRVEWPNQNAHQSGSAS